MSDDAFDSKGDALQLGWSPGQVSSNPETNPAVTTSLWLSAQPSPEEIRACAPTTDHSFTAGKHVVTKGRVQAKGKSVVETTGNATAVAHGKASIDGGDNSIVCATDQTKLSLSANATGYARDHAMVMVTMDHANLFARGQGDIHNHAQGNVIATDKRNVYLRSGTAWVSGDAAVEPSMSKPGDPVKAFARDHAIVITYDAGQANESPPQIELQDQAIGLNYDNLKQTLTITQAGGDTQVVSAKPDSTIWIRDSYASRHKHEKAASDDVVVRIRSKTENRSYLKPPAKLTGDALWIDIWPNGSTLLFNRAADVHYKSPLQMQIEKIATAPKHIIHKLVKD